MSFEKERKIRQAFFSVLEKGELKPLKKFLQKEKITFEKAVYISDLKDVLTTVLRVKPSLELVEYIVDNSDDYDDLNYSVTDNAIGEITPLLLAIRYEQFDIADFFIERGANIDTVLDHSDYLNILNCKNLLNEKKLKYMISKGYQSDFLDGFHINSLSCNLLKILYESTEEKSEIYFGRNCFFDAIDKENYNKIALFIQYDGSETKEGTFKRALSYLDMFDRKHHTSRKYTFLKKAQQNSLDFPIESTLVDQYLSPTMEENRKKIIDLIEKNDLSSLESFVFDNKIHIREFNTETFDLIIHAIEKDASIKLIEFLRKIGQYYSLDYHIKTDEVFKSVVFSKIGNFKTPVTAALCGERFEVVEYLQKNGANMNYNLIGNTGDKTHVNDAEHQRNSDILHYLYRNNCLTKDNLQYIFTCNHYVRIAVSNKMVEESIGLGNNETAKLIIQYFRIPIQNVWYKPALVNGNADMLEYLMMYDQRRNNEPIDEITHIVQTETIDDNALYRLETNLKNKPLANHIKRLIKK